MMLLKTLYKVWVARVPQLAAPHWFLHCRCLAAIAFGKVPPEFQMIICGPEQPTAVG